MPAMSEATIDRDGARPADTSDERDATLLNRLRTSGTSDPGAVQELHALLLRAARHQAGHTRGIGARLGRVQIDEAIVTAADEATMAVLSRLHTFQGRARFSTWAYKFGILHAAVELRKAAWRPAEIDLTALAEPASPRPGPEEHAEGGDLDTALRAAIQSDLTAHQRRVVAALLIDEVPIDVLADRLGTTRNALYKTLHDARARLRTALIARGYLTAPNGRQEVMS